MRALVIIGVLLLSACNSQPDSGSRHTVYRDERGGIIPEAQARRMLAESKAQSERRLDPLADAAAQEELIRRKNGWKKSGTAVRMRASPIGPPPLDAMFRNELARRGHAMSPSAQQNLPVRP